MTKKEVDWPVLFYRVSPCLPKTSGRPNPSEGGGLKTSNFVLLYYAPHYRPTQCPDSGGDLAWPEFHTLYFTYSEIHRYYY
ncbi:MAG: hypothetical protein IPI53_01060 [Saprospiraceae bacterium]|nr:hypothetical protein [Saprospiraceae bacterium]